ncbi:MAG: HEAT repeat domain-containing protein [Myxococcota bacterium]
MLRALTLALALVIPTAASTDEGRWPSWPTEVDRVAAPLVAVQRPAQDRERAAALVRLQRFPTALIEDHLLLALDDPALQVRREALRICYMRRVESCLEPATEQVRTGSAPSLRAAALRVIATDPRGERLDLLLQTMLDPSDALRAEAAQLAGWSAVTGEARVRTRRALLAKLSDTASVVRQRSVTALGLQGPGDGTLAIARLLEDPEPSVRAAAATALGHMRDPRASGALLRAIDGQNEGNVVRAMLTALARLPGDDVSAALLRYLDDPPVGVGSLSVAEAIGSRPTPEPALIDGLVARLREPALRAVGLRALMWIGQPAKPALQTALERGVEPELEREVQRLLDALTVAPAAKPDVAWPDLDDVGTWSTHLRSVDVVSQLEAASTLAADPPPWLVGQVHARLQRALPMDGMRGWVAAMAALPMSVAFRGDTLAPWGRLAALATDVTLAEGDRCLATLALGRARGRRAEAFANAVLHDLAGDGSPRVRSCVALGARDLDPALAGLFLLDADPRPRAAAAHVLSDPDLSTALSRRRAVLRRLDPDPRVRAAASSAPGGPGLRLQAEPTARIAWRNPPLWLGDAGVVLGTQGAVWTALPRPKS